MRKSRFTDAQIVGMIKEKEAGLPMAELCRKHGLSSARSDVVVAPETPGASVHEVLFATNRAPDENMVGATRSDLTTYGTARLPVSPHHKLGVLEDPGKTANPETRSGLVDAATTQSAVGLERLLAEQSAERAPGKRRVGVIVHANQSAQPVIPKRSTLAPTLERPEANLLGHLNEGLHLR